MYNFFVENNKKSGDCYNIDGADFNHIANVLRMNIGEQILVSEQGVSSLCEIVDISKNCVVAKILQENYIQTELSIKLHLYQGMPKADKLETIIQKAVELGANTIIPVETSRSIVKIDAKKVDAKVGRWQIIGEAAAKQCKRNIIPKVREPLSFKQFLAEIDNLDMLIVPYENKNGMIDTKETLKSLTPNMNVGVFVGPEGGIDQQEIEQLSQRKNVKIISLGSRILRTETASLTALSMLMLYAETNL